MPIEHWLEPQAHIVVIRYRAPYSLEEWTRAMDAIAADARFDAAYGYLADRRGAAPPAPAYARGVQDYLVAHPELSRGRRVALVVDSLVGYGMARMQELLNESAEMEARVFDSEAAARQWLEEDRSSATPT
jgi:hypothetical protein